MLLSNPLKYRLIRTCMKVANGYNFDLATSCIKYKIIFIEHYALKLTLSSKEHNSVYTSIEFVKKQIRHH